MSSVSEERSQPIPATVTLESANLLDEITRATRPKTSAEEERAKNYFKSFLQQVVKPGQVVSRDVETNIKAWIGQIDKLLSAQVSEILHDEKFQKLEGTWRGLHHLVYQSETGTELKIRVLNAKKKELFNNIEMASEFDQSNLFKTIYTAEYDMLGGTPYGMLVGDYEFDRSAEDIGLLKKISGVAAAAHAPFVANAGAGLFGFDSFEELPNPRDLAKIFDSLEYASWKAFRESEDSRYVALTMPRVLARLPYGKGLKTVDQFNYEENVDGTKHDHYTWMGASWAYATRITDAFAKYGWMMRSRGVEGGGVVENLPVHTFKSDDGSIAMKCPTEIAISDSRENELSKLGFLPLLHNKGSEKAVFMGAQSCQKPKDYFDSAAKANAELSTKFNLMLCTSRFAHYLKVIGRDKIGSFMELGECKAWLHDWIQNYVVTGPSLSDEQKAKRPLADATVDVQEVPGKPGHYQAVAYLRPHFQLEALTASLRLVAEIPERAN